jgi:hypothetical protein
MKFDKFAILVGAALSILLLVGVAITAMFIMGEARRRAEFEQQSPTATEKIVEVRNATPVSKPAAQPLETAD